MGEDYDSMEEFGKKREKWLKEELGLELLCGIPDKDTFRRVLERIKPSELRQKLNESLDIARSSRNVINIDGKTKRGAGSENPVHIISAFVSENQIVLGEVKSASKRSEIKAIPALLDTIDVTNGIVTIDAAGCQTDIAAKIITEEKADYVLALKKNQKHLYNAVEEYFMYNPVSGKCPKQWIAENGHGRVEQREYWLETN